MKLKKLLLVLALCAAIIIPQTGCGSEEPVSENQFSLDTICTITVYGMKTADAQSAIDQAFEKMKEYEAVFSKTIEGSDIYKLNQADGKPVQVKPETLEVIEKGVEYGRLSQGLFDITIGAVSELWDFTGNNPHVPEQAVLQKAVETVDYQKIKISGDKVTLENPDARLDLGGIAKGFIADRIAELMEQAGVKRAVISLGGNIVTIGEKEEGVPWKIGIERPYSERTEILGSVEMGAGTIVTSGIYQRYFKAGDKLYHHVLDPRTGYPIDNELDAVTIKGERGQSMDCDALGTICLMMGTEKGLQLLEEFEGIQAAFVDRSDKISEIKGMKIIPAE